MHWKLLLPLLGFMLALPAAADPTLEHLALEELLSLNVEGASRYSQPLADAPSSATVITAEDMERQGFQTLGDALSMARGVYTTNDHTYTYLGVRGFGRPGDYNSRILLLVDGARFNDPLYDQAMIGQESPIDLTWIKRLEFVPGPASALYGGNALFGVTNALLWSGADLDGSRMILEGGSQHTGNLKFLSGKQLADGTDWVMGVATGTSQGDSLTLDAPGQTARGLDDERYVKAFGKVSQAGWRLLATYANRYKEVPTGYWDTSIGASGTNTRDENLQLDLTHASSIATDWTQLARLHYGHYVYLGNYNYTPDPANRDEAKARWWHGEYRLGYTGIADHHFQFGGEIRRDQQILQKNFDITPYASILDDQRQQTIYSLMLQDEWRFAPNWLANMGLRADKIASQTMTSPRLALINRSLPDTTVKLLYGKAFRAANAYERFYTDGGFLQKANPDLLPERIETREIAVDYAFTPALRLGVSHYRYTLKDLIEQVNDPDDNLAVFTNQSASKAKGWEVEMEALRGGWRLRGSMAWQEVDLADQGTPTNSPQRLGKLFLDGPPVKGWQLGLNLQAMSKRKTLDGWVAGHVVGNLTLRQARSGPYGRWSLIVRNLGDTSYRDPVSAEQRQDNLPQDGRQWLVRWEAPL